MYLYMRKKLMACALVAAMSLSTLAGCAGKNTSSSKASSVDTSDQSVSAADYYGNVKKNAEIYKDFITIPEVKGVEIELSDTSTDVPDSDVETYISSLLSSAKSTENITEGTTKSGDKIVLDYSGKLDGQAFAGGTATDTEYTVGSGAFISDLDAGLVGLDLGKEYDIPCKFPDNYSSDTLAGKNVVFTVKVTAIKKDVIPSLTDEWVAANAASYGLTSTTVDGFKADVKNYLVESKKSTIVSNKYEAVWEKIKDSVVVSDYPSKELDTLMNNCKTNMKADYDQYATYYTQQGITSYDAFLKQNYNIDGTDAYDAYAREQAVDFLKEKMFYTVVAVNNGIEVSEQEILDQGEDFAAYYGYDNYQAILDSAGEIMNTTVGYVVLSQKVQDFIADNAKVTVKLDDTEKSNQ